MKIHSFISMKVDCAVDKHFLPQHSRIVHWLTSEDLLSLDSAFIFHKNGYSIVAAYPYAEV